MMLSAVLSKTGGSEELAGLSTTVKLIGKGVERAATAVGGEH